MTEFLRRMAAVREGEMRLFLGLRRLEREGGPTVVRKPGPRVADGCPDAPPVLRASLILPRG